MRSIKFLLAGVFLVLGVVFSGLYTSCTKDVCKGVTCINRGTCSAGNCNCKKGVGGLSCEVIYRDLYAGKMYKGTGTSDSGFTYIDNTFTFTAGVDSDYTKMSIAWNNFGPQVINFAITLSDSSTTSGSTFIIDKTDVDSFTYNGSGSVNSTTASLTLTRTHPIAPPVHITLHNFVRQ